jgi:hypothetical protein
MGQVVDLPRRRRKVQPAFFTSSMICQPAWEPPARAHGLRPSGDPNFPWWQAYFGKASVRSLEDTSAYPGTKSSASDRVCLDTGSRMDRRPRPTVSRHWFIHIHRARPSVVPPRFGAAGLHDADGRQVALFARLWNFTRPLTSTTPRLVVT